MATIYLTFSTKVDTTGKQEIKMRFAHGKIDQRAKTGIFIPAVYTDENGKKWNLWDSEKQAVIIPNFRLETKEKKKLKQFLADQSERLTTLKTTIQTIFTDSNKTTIAADWLITTIDKYNFPEKYMPKIEEIQKQSFFSTFDEFMAVKSFSEWRNKAYKVVIRTLKRFEMYIKTIQDKSFSLDFDNITPIVLSEFVLFLRNEHNLFEQYPSIYEAVPESRTPQPRGQNTINGILEKMRTLFIWAVNNDKTKNNPFRNYSIDECAYGTPIYISIDERNLLFNTDFSHNPSLEKQRDIFVFQCLIGCRVGDLYRLTKQNVINGEIHYIARKTKDGRPITVEVPLNTISKAILDKYADFEGDKLLPYISEQRYNIAIKEAFRVAGLTRSVVTLDPLTRESVIRPLNEIASSHLARRCFVGNLYKQVQDPNLVGKLSGHKEGSRAFARYREIDDEMRTKLVKMLE